MVGCCHGTGCWAACGTRIGDYETEVTKAASQVARELLVVANGVSNKGDPGAPPSKGVSATGIKDDPPSFELEDVAQGSFVIVVWVDSPNFQRRYFPDCIRKTPRVVFVSMDLAHELFAKHQGCKRMAGGHAMHILTEKLADTGGCSSVCAKTGREINTTAPRELVGTPATSRRWFRNQQVAQMTDAFMPGFIAGRFAKVKCIVPEVVGIHVAVQEVLVVDLSFRIGG